MQCILKIPQKVAQNLDKSEPELIEKKTYFTILCVLSFFTCYAHAQLYICFRAFRAEGTGW